MGTTSRRCGTSLLLCRRGAGSGGVGSTHTYNIYLYHYIYNYTNQFGFVVVGQRLSLVLSRFHSLSSEKDIGIIFIVQQQRLLSRKTDGRCNHLFRFFSGFCRTKMTARTTSDLAKPGHLVLMKATSPVEYNYLVYRIML
jgi:hypothetical protein